MASRKLIYRYTAWLKRQKSLVANTAMFAGFLTLGDYLAVQLDRKLNEKPRHHPVHRTTHHDSIMALANNRGSMAHHSSSSSSLPDHHYVHHRHHLQTDSNDNNHQKSLSNNNDGDGLFHKLGCVFKSGTIIGTLNYCWYNMLDNRLPGIGGKTIALKVFLDQLIASNFTNVGFFLTCGLFEGKTPKQCANELSAKYLFIYISDCLFWIPAQTLNFKYIPARYRVAYVSVATVIWNIFLCCHRNNDIRTILLQPQHQHHAQAQLQAA